MNQTASSLKTLQLRSSLVAGCLSVVLFALIGCTKTPPTEAKNETITPPVVASNEPSTPPEAPAIDLAKLPESLKTDAFEYYGLNRTDPINLEVVTPNGNMTGVQKVKLISIEGDKALFEVTNSGAVEGASGVFSLEPGGIKVVKSEKAKVFANEWEFPSGLVPGKSWTSTNEISGNGQTLKLKTTNKVVGFSKVETKVGKYSDALLVTSTSVGTRSGVGIRMENKQWFVKGRGMVKVEFTATQAGAKAESYTLQETK